MLRFEELSHAGIGVAVPELCRRFSMPAVGTGRILCIRGRTWFVERPRGTCFVFHDTLARKMPRFENLSLAGVDAAAPELCSTFSTPAEVRGRISRTFDESKYRPGPIHVLFYLFLFVRPLGSVLRARPIVRFAACSVSNQLCSWRVRPGQDHRLHQRERGDDAMVVMPGTFSVPYDHLKRGKWIARRANRRGDFNAKGVFFFYARKINKNKQEILQP